MAEQLSTHQPVADHSTAERGALRGIAAFEAFKGLIAIAAGIGVLSLLHHDLHQLATALIGHIGLDPGSRYPATLINYVDVLQNTDRRYLLLAVGAYVLVRFTEAYGLWRDQAWGEWVGAVSGGVYVPFELRHLLHRPTATGALVLLTNVVVVCFLGWQLWKRRQAGRS